MVKVWINTRQGLKQITIRKNRNKDTYSLVEKRKIKKRKILKKSIKRKSTKRLSKRDIGRRVIKRRIENPKEKVFKKKKSIRKTPRKIDEIFEKKVSKIIIKDVLNISTSELNLQYKPLLKSVLNKKSLGDFASEDVLNAMIKQENINKIKWRFEIRADAFDRDGTKVLQMIKGSGGDLMSLRERMKKGIWRGASVDYDIDVGDGYVFKLVNKGNIDRVEVTVIFRS